MGDIKFQEDLLLGSLKDLDDGEKGNSRNCGERKAQKICKKSWIDMMINREQGGDQRRQERKRIKKANKI